ncbi:MAG: glycosyltransferase, partial [Acidimicrobiales bacterium]
MSDNPPRHRRVALTGATGIRSIVFIVATACVNLLGFVFHILISHSLGPKGYGLVVALISLVSVASAPFMALQATVIQEVVAHQDSEPVSIRRVASLSILGSVVLTVVMVVASPLIASYLSVAVTPVIVVALYLSTSVATPVLNGTLLGKLRFTPVALGLLAGAVIRVVLTAVFAATHVGGIEGPLVASVLGTVAQFAVLIWVLRPELRVRSNTRLRLPGKNLARTAAAILGLAALTGIDTVLARHLFSAQEAGLYAAAATLGAIAMIAPAAIVALTFPRLAKDRGVGANARRNLLLSAGAIALVGFSAAAVISIVPHFVITTIFGGRYSEAAPILRILALRSATLALVGLFMYFHLARRSMAACVPWGGAIAAAIATLVFHPTPRFLALGMLFFTAGTVVVMGVLALATSDQRSNATRQLPVRPAPAGAVSATAAVGAEQGRSEDDVDFTIVVPHYNAGARLLQHVADLVEVLRDAGVSAEIVAVSDGTEDGSDEGLALLGPEVRIVELEQNMGKGMAVRVGLSLGRGRHLGFIDGDGDIPAAVLRQFIELMKTEEPHFVIGSKLHPDSNIVYPPMRRVYSRGYQIICKVLLGVGVSDTQTGVKLVSREVLQAVLPLLSEQGFALDVELLAVARRFGYRNIVELPIEIRERFTSTITAESIWTMLLDTLAIAWRLRVVHKYDYLRQHPAALAPPPLRARVRRLRRVTVQPPEPVRPLPAGIVVPSFRQVVTMPGIPVRPLRILVCNWRDLAHPLGGGAEVWTHEVVSCWRDMGHDVTWFSAAVRDVPAEEVVNGIRHVRRGSRWSVYREARRYFEEQGEGAFDLVVDEVNTRPFGAPAWANGTKVLTQIHQLCKEVWFYEMPLAVAAAGRYVLEPHWLRPYRDTPVTTLSDSSRRSLIAYDLRNVEVIPVGFTPGPPISGFKELAPTLIYV